MMLETLGWKCERHLVIFYLLRKKCIFQTIAMQTPVVLCKESIFELETIYVETILSADELKDGWVFLKPWVV